MLVSVGKSRRICMLQDRDLQILYVYGVALCFEHGQLKFVKDKFTKVGDEPKNVKFNSYYTVEEGTVGDYAYNALVYHTVLRSQVTTCTIYKDGKETVDLVAVTSVMNKYKRGK